MKIIKILFIWISAIITGSTYANVDGLEGDAASKVPLHMCVWDPIGNAGPVGQILKEAKLYAWRWGVDLTWDIYSEERIPIEEFKLGRCDAVNVLGFRAREFNSFTGSINAIGAIPSYKHLGILIKSMMSPKAAKYMRKGEYEIIGIGPAGAIFMFTRDRQIILPEDFAGKRMSVIDGIPENAYLTKKNGITPVNSTILNSVLKFNNGTVDLAAAPAIVYEPFEMHKGLEPNGGVYREPFLHITMQVIARWENLPEGFADKARAQAVERYADFVKWLKDPEATIPEKYWIDIPPDLYDYWVENFRESRVELAEMGIYDKRTLKLMRKIRCKLGGTSSECTSAARE